MLSDVPHYTFIKRSSVRLLTTILTVFGLLYPILPVQAGFMADDVESGPENRLSPALQTAGLVNIDITKQTSTPVIRQGDTAYFTIIIKNISDEGINLDNISLDEDECDIDTITIIDKGNGDDILNNGESWTYTCSKSNVQASFTNTATVSGQITPGGTFIPSFSDSANVAVIDPAIAIDITPASQTVGYNGTANFNVTVTNTGNADLSSVTVVSTPNVCNQSLDNITAGNSKDYTCSISPVNDGVILSAIVTGSNSGFEVSAGDNASVRYRPKVNQCAADGVTGAIAYWPFNSGDPGDDFIAGYDLNCDGGVCPASAAGIIGDGVSFDGSTTKYTTPNIPGETEFDWPLEQSFSIEAWVQTNPGSCTSGNEVVVGRRSEPNSLAWWLGCDSNSGGVARFHLASKGHGNSERLYGTQPINDGQPHHLVAVREALDASGNGFIRLYVDGQEVASKFHAYSSGFVSPDTPINIGWFNQTKSSGYHFNGLIDEVTIYNEALTLTAVQRHYFESKNGHGYCDTAPLAPTIYSQAATEATVQTLYNYDVNAIGDPDPTFSLTENPAGMSINTTTGLIDWTPLVSQRGAHTVTVAATNAIEPDAQQTFTLNVTQDTICQAGTLSYWPLDETTGSVIFADFFAGYDGQCGGASCPTQTTDGQVNNAQQFDGDDQITVPPQAEFDWSKDDSFSIELWVKTSPGYDCNTNGQNEIFVGRDDSTTTNLHWWVGCDDLTQKAQFVLQDINGNGPSFTGGPSLTDGAWHHVVAVRDNATDINQLYVDGIPVASQSHDYTAGFSSAVAGINFGWLNRGGGGYHFTGALDEIAIYNKALSQADILANYNRSQNGQSYCYNPGLVVEKGPASQFVIAENQANFTITITNTGDTVLSNVDLIDPTAPACDKLYPTLNIGQSDTYTCSTTDTGGLLASFTNIISTTADLPSIIGDAIYAESAAQVIVKNPSLTLVKTAHAEVVPTGSTVTFTLVVTNTGNDDLANIDLTDTQCSPPSGPEVDAGEDGILSEGEVWTYTCVVSNATADVVNSASVSAESVSVPGHIVQSADTVVVDVINPNLEIQKTPNVQQIRAGVTASFNITVTNTSTDTNLTNVTVTDALVPDCNLDPISLNAGQETSYSCVSDPLYADLTNEAIVTGLLLNSQTITDTDIALVDVITPTLSVAKTTDTPIVTNNSDVIFKITVKNTSLDDAPLTNIIVDDPICDSLTGPTGSGSDDGVLDPNEIWTYTCVVNNVVADFTNEVSITGTPPVGPDVSDSDSASVRVIDPDLFMTKLPDLQYLEAGSTANFTITLVNQSPSASMTNVVLTDELCDTPPTTPDSGDNGDLVLQAGESWVYACSVSNVSADFDNTATITLTLPTNEVVGLNATASVDVVAGSVQVIKDPVTLPRGDDAVFTITVSNTGDGFLSDVQVDDPQCDALTGPSGDNGNGTLDNGESWGYTCTVNAVTASFTNWVTVTATPPAGAAVSSSDSATATVADMTVDIVPANQQVQAGSTANFTVTVTNSGDADLTGLTTQSGQVADCSRALGDLPVASPTTTYACSLSNVTANVTNQITATATADSVTITAGDTASISVITDYTNYLPIVLK